MNCFLNFLYKPQHTASGIVFSLLDTKLYFLMFYSLSQINQMDQGAFVAAFGAVFEQTPQVAARAWAARPFANLDELHGAMMAVVGQMSPAEQLALIVAHPELGARVKMAADSVAEQASVGLDSLNRADYERLQALNRAYRDKFGFPFVMAVRGQSVAAILAAMEQRVGQDRATEMAQALAEIACIARFRLEASVS